MARFLVVSTPIPAHSANARPFVEGLLARGQQVTWATSADFAAQAAAAGADVFVLPDARIQATGRPGVRAAAALYGGLLAAAEKQIHVLRDVVTRDRPDLVFGDSLSFAGALVAERTGLPWVSFGDGPLHFPDADTPPFGSGLRYRLGLPWRARNRSAQAVSDLAFSRPKSQYSRLRRALALPPRRTRLIEAAISPLLHLHGGAPSFEYPRKRLAEQVRWVGSLSSPRPDWVPPAWWSDLQAWPGPVIAITQGTMRRDPDELLGPAIEELRSSEAFVIALGTAAASFIPQNRKTSRGRVERDAFIPYEALFPRIDVLITNGGWSGVTTALAHGVPVVQVGRTEEKADVGARIAWSGVGITLNAARLRPGGLAAATHFVMTDPRFRQAASAMAEDLAQYDARRDGARHLIACARDFQARQT